MAKHLIDRVRSAQARSGTGDPHPAAEADPRRRKRVAKPAARSEAGTSTSPPRSHDADPLAQPAPGKVRNAAGDRKRDDRTPRKGR